MKLRMSKKNKQETMEINGVEENGVVDGPCKSLVIINYLKTL